MMLSPLSTAPLLAKKDRFEGGWPSERSRVMASRPWIGRCIRFAADSGDADPENG